MHVEAYERCGDNCLVQSHCGVGQVSAGQRLFVDTAWWQLAFGKLLIPENQQGQQQVKHSCGM